MHPVLLVPGVHLVLEVAAFVAAHAPHRLLLQPVDLRRRARRASRCGRVRRRADLAVGRRDSLAGAGYLRMQVSPL
jgi:hypothetical protein